MPLPFSVTYTFVANTKARAGEVNQDFSDVLAILSGDHHDPNIYSGANPITNSGIAPNAQILASQLQYPITMSGLINYLALDNVPVAKGGIGLAKVNPYDLIYGGPSNNFLRLGIGSANQVVGVDPTGTFLQYFNIPSASVFNTVAGEALTQGDALHISPYYQSDGGVLLDSQGATNGASTTKSITVSNNSNRVLLVGVNAGSAPSGVTFNGSSMTLVDSQAFSSGVGQTLYVYKLVAPTATTANISVSGVTPSGIAYASYYNVNQSTYVEASGKFAGSSSTVTTVSACAFVHIFGGDSHSSGSTSSYSGSYTSKYLTNGVVSATVGDITGNTNIGSASVGKYNETFSPSVGMGFGGGFGTIGSASIAVSLAPATAPTVGAFRANASAATINEPLIDFGGFASTNASAGAAIAVVLTNIVSAGLSGLTPGRKYYLQNSAGQIGLTRGTYGKCIGFALSASTLITQGEKTVGAAMSKSASYTYTAECDGTAQLRGANTIITDGITYTGVASATMTVPVSRGKTYIFSGGSDIYFTPIA